MGNDATRPALPADTGQAGEHTHNPLVRYFKLLGPGLVTGASDDDPSGITTYSVAGASLGYGMLWTAVATLPLTIAVQLICARIGLVSGHGLAGAVRHHYPRSFLYAACVLLLAANVFNLSADLGGMAAVAAMLTGIPSLVFVPLFGLSLIAITVYTSYATFARYLKWLTAVLFAYILAAFLARPDWEVVLQSSFVPTLSRDPAYVPALQNLGVILGRQGHIPEANACFEQVLKLQPGNADAKFWLGVGLANLDRLDEARQKFQEIADIDPDNRLIRETLAAFDTAGAL